jgi:hypothetical protein
MITRNGILKYLLAVGLLIAAGIAIGAAQEQTDDQSLRDNAIIDGAEGKLINSGQDKYSFEFDTDINDGREISKATEPLEMLKCSTLERMIADSKERSEARYRLWGKITKLGDKNYIFATYYLALRKLEKPVEKQTPGEKNIQSINSPNDILNIPEEITSKLRQSEVLPAGNTSSEIQSKQDTIFAGRTGFVTEKDGYYEFQPDGLGRGVEKFYIKLLPCRTLELALEQIHNESNPARFNIAGVMTKYNNEQYLLLQKATRIYSYGNLGR